MNGSAQNFNPDDYVDVPLEGHDKEAFIAIIHEMTPLIHQLAGPIYTLTTALEEYDLEGVAGFFVGYIG